MTTNNEKLQDPAYAAIRLRVIATDLPHSPNLDAADEMKYLLEIWTAEKLGIPQETYDGCQKTLKAQYLICICKALPSMAEDARKTAIEKLFNEGKVPYDIILSYPAAQKRPNLGERAFFMSYSAYCSWYLYERGDAKAALQLIQNLFDANAADANFYWAFARNGQKLDNDTSLAYKVYPRALLALGRKEEAFTFVSDNLDSMHLSSLEDFYQNPDFVNWQKTYPPHVEKLKQAEADEKAAPPIRARLGIIREKLNKLKTLDKKLKVIGAKKHKYELKPCETATKVQVFEFINKTKLPLDFKYFIQELGNGGAAPTEFFWGFNTNAASSDYGHPFPFTRQQPFNQSEWAQEKTSKHTEEIYNNRLNGTKRLTQDAKNSESLLILTGAEAGTVWYQYENYGIFPIIHPETKKPMSFLDWYEYWLDKNLAAFDAKADVATCFKNYSECVTYSPSVPKATDGKFHVLAEDDFGLGAEEGTLSTENTLWGAKAETNVQVRIPLKTGTAKLAQHMAKVNELCAWVEANQKAIEKTLLENEYIETFEQYIASSYDEVKAPKGKKAYETPDGDKIVFPITPAKFKKSLHIAQLDVYFCDGDPADEYSFKASFDKPVIALSVRAEPFSCGMIMSILIDHKFKIECDGTRG